MGQGGSTSAGKDPSQPRFVRDELVLSTDLYRLFHGRAENADVSDVSLFYYLKEGVKEGVSVAPLTANAHSVHFPSFFRPHEIKVFC